MLQLSSWIQFKEGSKLVRLYPAKNDAATYTLERYLYTQGHNRGY